MGGILGLAAMAATTRVETVSVGYEQADEYYWVPICELRVTFLNHLIYREVGREIARSSANGLSFGPDDALNDTLVKAVLSMIAVFVIHFSFLGASLAFGIRRLSSPSA